MRVSRAQRLVDAFLTVLLRTGGSVFSIIASQLIERVGISWAFRIIGCLFFAINLPCSWMLKSRAARVPWSTKKTEDGEKVKAIDW